MGIKYDQVRNTFTYVYMLNMHVIYAQPDSLVYVRWLLCSAYTNVYIHSFVSRLQGDQGPNHSGSSSVSWMGQGIQQLLHNYGQHDKWRR